MKFTLWQLQWQSRSFCVPAAMLAFAVNAHAQDRVIPPVGGPGGSEFVARCPPGQLLGGVELHAGDDVDAIRPLCRTVSKHVEQILEANNDIRAPQKYVDYVTYLASEAEATTEWFGNRGTSKITTLECNNVDGGPGEAAAAPIVAGIYVEAEGVDMVTVNRITLLCEYLTFGTPSRDRDREWWHFNTDTPNFEAPRYADSHTGAFQSQPATKAGTSLCPVSQDNRGITIAMHAVGIHGRAGAYVDAVGLICDYAKPPPPPLPRPTQFIVRNDFNGDGRGDILWHNSATGESQIWFMSGFSRIGRATVSDGARPALVGPPWGLVGSRDFNADGKTDLLWHNSSTGETQIWYMNGSRLAGRATVLGEDGKPALVGLPWSIVGTSDKNGDSQPDIIWHNGTTGEMQSWHLRGNRVSIRKTVIEDRWGYAAYVGFPWSIVGANDFDGDGKTDLLWHNSSTGETQIWYMSNYTVSNRATVLAENGSPSFVGLPWSIVGTNDFNLDGTADILWHNGATGETQVWLMKNNRVVRRATVLGENHKADMVVAPWSIVNH